MWRTAPFVVLQHNGVFVVEADGKQRELVLRNPNDAVTALAVDRSNGDVYLAFSNHVTVVRPDGSLVSELVTKDSHQLRNIIDLSIDSDRGLVHIIEAQQSQIKVFNRDGMHVRTSKCGGSDFRLFASATDASGELFAIGQVYGSAQLMVCSYIRFDLIHSASEC